MSCPHRFQRQIRGSLVACLVIAHEQPAVGQRPSAHEFREVHLGMEVRFVLVHANEQAARAIARRAFARVEVLEQMMSDWRPGSELNRLSAASAAQWAAVSPELFRLLILADTIARATDGAFDYTVGPLTHLWREAARTGQPIADTARAMALRSVGFQYVEVDSASFRVRLLRPAMRLDLGAIAKGWILDDVARLLGSAGVKHMLLEAGGDVVTRGAPPGETGWRIVVQTSRGDTMITVNDAAVSTSASRAQLAPGAGHGQEGHVFRTSTGRGATDTPQITVIGDRAAVTDALATAFSLIAPEKRTAIAGRWKVRVVDP